MRATHLRRDKGCVTLWLGLTAYPQNCPALGWQPNTPAYPTSAVPDLWPCSPQGIPCRKGSLNFTSKIICRETYDI